MPASPFIQPLSYGRAVKPLWHLPGDAVFLNHGSYGAVPRAVLAAQDEWRRRMETQPVRFMLEALPQGLHEARRALAERVGSDAGNLVFVDNATTGVNTVLHSLDLRTGQKILVTSHGYPAVSLALRHWSERAGIDIETVTLSLPLDSDAILNQLDKALAAGPALLILDHITSPSAAVLPVHEACALARRHAVPVLVDGAHAPGQIPLNLEQMGADYYTGNLHKWLFAPKGSAFLWAAPARQAGLHPLVISHGYDPGGFQREFDWTGTKDATGILSVPAAVEFFHRLGGDALMARNRDLAAEAAEYLVRRWGTSLIAPPSMRAAMATIALPGRIEQPTAQLADRWSTDLWHRHRIEIPAFALDGSLWIRLSAQAYNDMDDYVALADALD